MNHKTLEAYGLKSLDEIKGKKMLRDITEVIDSMWHVIMTKSAKDL